MAISHERSGDDSVLSTEKPPSVRAHMESVLTRRNAALCLALAATAVLLILDIEHHMSIRFDRPSVAPHFVYQAEALLHARWDVSLPASVTDIVRLHGKNYVVYMPFPAIALMPFVAIWGLHTSDVLFTAIVSALGAPFLFLMFEQARANGLTARTWTEHALMTLLLYFGSIYWGLSLGGTAWFTAQIVCAVCTLIGLLLGLRRHFFAASLLLLCAFFSRPTALFGYVVLLALAWDNAGLDPQLRRFLSSLARAVRQRSLRALDTQAIPWRRLLPVVACMALLLSLYCIHNALIFGAPFETGYGILTQQRYPQIHYGQFNWRYVPANVIANFFSFPVVSYPGGPWDLHPAIDLTNRAMSIGVFVTTPLFLFLFWKNKTRSALRSALWLTIILIVLEALFFNASGWLQFGARYLFDGYPFAFLLLALNDAPIDWRYLALGALGVIVNWLGAIQFWTNTPLRL